MPKNLRAFIAVAAIAAVGASAHAQRAPNVGGGLGQTGPRIIDRSRIDQSPTQAAPTAAGVAGGGGRVAGAPPPKLEDEAFVLHDVTVEGATAIPADRLRATWAARQGQTVRVRDIYAISDAIGQLYAEADYALYSVSVPKQDFRSGHVRVHVTEGYVESVAIEGNTAGADLGMLKAQAARIVADRPLRQATLERNILLMSDIAGLKVGSRFEALPGQPGAVVLKLAIQRKTYEYGFDYNNQGNALLSRTQVDVNAAVNSLFREGDRTQLVVGTPVTIERYQYYGLSHLEPIGSDGAKVTVNVGELVTNGVNNTDSGNAQILDVTGSYPLIRAIKESLAATVSFDLLNSDDALLGQTLTDERTRAFRGGLSWAKQDALLAGLNGVTALSGSLSQGVSILGARRGNDAYGGPGFTKVNARLSREQDLPWSFVVRGKVAAQYALNNLPATEQFAYGGTDFGQAFDTAAVLSDSALAVGLEVAYRLEQSWFPDYLTENEAFVFGDYGRFWNRNTAYEVPQDRGASGGFGVRTKLLGKFGLEIGAANALIQPTSSTDHEHWRFLAQAVGKF